MFAGLLLSVSWQVLPCWGGGYVQGVSLCPSDSARRYMYVDVGGPYRSDDAGKSWRPLHANMPLAMRERGFDQVRSLSVDPRDADSVVILGGGCGEKLGGFAVTRDGGENWRVTGDAFAHGNGPKRMEGFCLSRNPFDPDELVGGEDRSGLFVSRDNGASWMLTGPTNVWFTDVRYDATVTGRVYASSPQIPTNILARYWQVGASCRTPRQFGFFRSDDGARTWRRLSDESPSEIAQIPGDGRLVGIFGRQHVKVSKDGGISWEPFEDGLYIAPDRRTEPWADGGYYALSAGHDFWLIGDGNGNKFRRGAGDATWTRLGLGRHYAGDPRNEPRLAGRNPEEIRMTALMTFVTDPKDDRHWLTTDWYELWETFDAGETWTTRLKGVMQLCSFDVVFDPNSESNICCCLCDMGAFVSTDGGRTFRVARGPKDGPRRFPNNVATALYLRDRPGVAICAGARGRDTGLWRSADAGLTWEPLAAEGLPQCVPGKSAVSGLQQDPLDGSVLVTMSGPVAPGGGGVYRSRNEGASWTWEGEGFSASKGFDFDINASHGPWPRLSISPDGTAVAAGNRGDGAVFFRWPGDVRWQKGGLRETDWRRYPLVADPHVAGRFLCGGYSRAVQESTDGGRTWHAFLPLKGHRCKGISFDRHVPGSVVFGCYDGLFVSSDGGATLREIPDGLRVPSGPSRAVLLDRGRLFFLTSGSGVWRADLSF